MEPLHRQKGTPWQNRMAAQCTVQRRLADYHCEPARTLEDAPNPQAAFSATFNTPPHWAHRTRADGHRTPGEVLGGLRGRVVEPQRLRELFGRTELRRTVHRYGVVSVQRVSRYADKGLARQRVSLWIYEGQLRIAYPQTFVARSRCL
jgi:hypothetical protein